MLGMVELIRRIINQGEGLQVEFKEARNSIPKNVYQTVCAFANTRGGEIIFGVDDNGDISGIDADRIEQLKKDFVTTINDPSKLCPSLYLSVLEFELDGKLLLYINVPASSEVHYCSNKLFVRNEDADLDITKKNKQISELYLKKEQTYSENRIYKYVTLDNLRLDLIDRCKRLAIDRMPTHPWKNLSIQELLKSVGLYKQDYATGEEGYTLACVLLFGKDEVIQSVLPHFRTDLILKINNIDRYDDRDDVRTNLIECYDRIMAFVQKHLPSPFFLNGNVRINIRDIIFREIAVNVLIHREYSKKDPAKLVIEKDRIFIENGSKPCVHGIITPSESVPYPKNPTIAKVFREIGLAEELGSGVRNIFKYAKIYAGTEPELIDKDTFKINWPTALIAKATEQVSEQATEQVSDERVKQHLLSFCETPKSAKEMMHLCGYKNRGHFFKNIITPLIESGRLDMTQKKHNHPNLKYVKNKKT